MSDITIETLTKEKIRKYKIYGKEFINNLAYTFVKILLYQ